MGFTIFSDAALRESMKAPQRSCMMETTRAVLTVCVVANLGGKSDRCLGRGDTVKELAPHGLVDVAIDLPKASDKLAFTQKSVI